MNTRSRALVWWIVVAGRRLVGTPWRVLNDQPTDQAGSERGIDEVTERGSTSWRWRLGRGVDAHDVDAVGAGRRRGGHVDHFEEAGTALGVNAGDQLPHGVALSA
jgi:hypothetical protein